MEERLAQSKTCASRIQQLLFYCMKYIMVRRIFNFEILNSFFPIFLNLNFFSQMSLKYIKDLLSSFTPWQGRIKDIESHFGSVVSSYFVFLRYVHYTTPYNFRVCACQKALENASKFAIFLE